MDGLSGEVCRVELLGSQAIGGPLRQYCFILRMGATVYLRDFLATGEGHAERKARRWVRRRLESLRGGRAR